MGAVLPLWAFFVQPRIAMPVTVSVFAINVFVEGKIAQSQLGSALS